MTQATELRELASLLRVHDGKIGIGPLTANPPYTLSLGQTNVAGAHTIRLAGNGNPKHEIQFREAGTSYGFTFRYAGDAADNKLHIVQHENSANGTEVMTFKRDSMEVGIGTDSPDLLYEGLHIKSANPSLKIEGTATNSWEFIHLKQPNHDRLIGMRTTGNIVINSGTNLDANNMLVIDTAGKVGVNVEYPDHDLDVNGAIATRQVRHSISPTLSLDFANSKQLDSRITFYRDSIATYYDSKGIIRYANVNEPRFDHDPATGESKGLLIEEARTNIFNYTNNPEKWSLMNAGSSSPIVNSVLSPDGTMNATKLIVTGGDPYFYQNGLTLNGTYTFSFWIKAFGSTVGKHYTVRGANIGTSFSIAPSGGLPSEWTRITHTFTSGSTTTAYVGIEAPDSSPANGDELSIWGAQLELGSFASSLIPSDDKFTSRSSIATYHDENGVLRTAPANSPRYGYKYDGRKWVETGLILENASTNHVGKTTNKFANPFSDGNYQIAPVDSTGETLAPDGSYTASKMVPTTGASFNYSTSYSESSAFSNGAVQVNSVYAKAGTTEFLWMSMPSTGEPNASFNLSTGQVERISSGLFDAGMEYAGNGWWRCYIMGVVAGSPATTAITFSIADDGTGSRQSADYLYLWGKQIETDELTSHIVNNASTGTVTRSADVASSVAYTRDRDYAESRNVDSLLPDVNQSNIDFTLYGDLQGIAHNAGFQQAIYLEDTSDSGNMYVTLFSAYNGNNTIASSYNINGVARNFGNWTSTASDIALRWKIAMGIEENNSRAAANGVLGSSAAGYWNGGGTFDRFYIGNGYQGGRTFNGWIRKITYYDKRLSNDEITALTENN